MRVRALSQSPNLYFCKITRDFLVNLHFPRIFLICIKPATDAVTGPQGRLFGTNGVRFIPGVSADLEFVIKFAECIGTYFADGEILVGRDGRFSGEAMSLALTSGLMS